MGDRPMNKFYGDFMRTTITDNPEVVSAWISKIESIHPMNGFPPNIFGLSYSPKPVSILRICIGPDCLVYQLINTSEIPKTLSHFLIMRCYIFVGAEIEVVDLKKLEEDYGINKYDIDAVDLWCVAAKRYGRTDLKNASLKQLVRLALEKDQEQLEMVDSLRKALDAMLVLEKEKQVEMIDSLRKALDAMLDLEKEIDDMNMNMNMHMHMMTQINQAKVEYDCISTFVSFGLGQLLKANQFVEFEAN